MLNRFKWYRKWKGGYWEQGQATGEWWQTSKLRYKTCSNFYVMEDYTDD